MIEAPDPAEASPEEGRRTIDVLGSILAEAVLNELGVGMGAQTGREAV